MSELKKLAAAVQTEADIAARPGQWKRLEAIAERLEALADAAEPDSGRWSFFREHFHDSIEGYALHDWIGAKCLKYGGLDKTIDAAMAIAKEPKP